LKVLRARIRSPNCQKRSGTGMNRRRRDPKIVPAQCACKFSYSFGMNNGNAKAKVDLVRVDAAKRDAPT